MNYDKENIEHRREFGKEEEIVFNEYLINNNLNYNYVSYEDIYNFYDFIKEENDKIKIIELKSRKGSIDEYQEVLVDKGKIKNFIKLKKIFKDKNIEMYFVFNLKHEYFIYQVDIDELKGKIYEKIIKGNLLIYIHQDY